MKNLRIVLFGLLIIASCDKEKSIDYLTLSGTLENNKDSLITVSSKTGIIKTIKINDDGSFKDTLKVNKPDIYVFQTSANKRAPLYLKNGFNLVLNGDSEKLMKSLTFSGEGASNSKFILSQINLTQKIGNPVTILALEEDEFNKKITSLKNKYDSILTIHSDLDSSLTAMANTQNKQMVSYFENTYKNNKKTALGAESPKFENYTSANGGKKSLATFKGKYVYIDVWATWCGPCVREIPALKNLEKLYHNKNIEFVSISTDNAQRNGGSWEAAEKKWKDFLKENKMTGTQLWAGQDRSFLESFQVRAIPRFILIDPKGNISNANAPRPSDPKLKELFTSLGI